MIFRSQIVYFKEKEDDESALHITQIQQQLIDNFKTHYDENVRLNTFLSIDPHFSRLLQVADLFTSSINRVLNHQRKNPQSRHNAKDEFAEYVYELLSVEVVSYDTTRFQKEEIGRASCRERVES